MWGLTWVQPATLCPKRKDPSGSRTYLQAYYPLQPHLLEFSAKSIHLDFTALINVLLITPAVEAIYYLTLFDITLGSVEKHFLNDPI